MLRGSFPTASRARMPSHSSSGSQRACLVMVCLLGLAAVGIICAGVSLLGTDPDKCSASRLGRRRLEPKMQDSAASQASRQAFRQHVNASTPDRANRRLSHVCTSQCTDVVNTTQLFSELLADLDATGDVKALGLLRAISSFDECVA